MEIFLLILKIIGGIILSVLGLVILALFVKIRIIADYGEEKSVLVKWLFVKIPVYPVKKKDKKNNNQPAEEATPQSQDVTAATDTPQADNAQLPDSPSDEAENTNNKADVKTEKPNIAKIFMDSNGGVGGLVLLIKEVFSYIGSFFGGIFRAFVIDELMVDMTVTKNDAAETAIYYGQLCSTVFPMLGSFVTKYKVKKYDFNITPDFLARKNSADMHIAFGFRPAKLIGVVLLLVGRLVFKVGFKVAFRMLKPVLQSRKKAKNITNNNTEESGVSNE